MKVSIITATFNSSLFIYDTYNSLCKQTITDWEWIVTDDCSTDNTYKILEQISSSDHRVRIFKTQLNSGAAVARNFSILHATGDFLAFIDSDDLWYEKKLEYQLSFMGDSIDFSFTAYELINDIGVPLGKFVDFTHFGSFDYEDILRKKATIGCSTVILRRSAFLGLQMPLLRTGQDYATWLNCLKIGNRAFLLNKVLTKYRITPNSISRNKFKKLIRQWSIYRKIENLSFFKSVICFYFYAIRAIFRK